MKKILGISISIQTTKIGVVNQFGEVEQFVEFKNEPLFSLEVLVEKILNWLEKIGYDFFIDIEKIGISFPSFINYNDESVNEVEQFNWTDFPSKQQLQVLFKKKKVSLLNTHAATALGEYWTGAAKKFSSEIFYELDENLNGAIVIDGKLFTGDHGFAGQFQKNLFVNNEDYWTTPFFQKIVNKMKQDLNDKTNQELSLFFKQGDLKPKNLTFPKFLELYLKNNKSQAGKKYFLEAFDPLLKHISIMANALDLKTVVIGGNICQKNQNLNQILEEELTNLVNTHCQKNIQIKTASLGTKATVVGSAYYAITDWEWN